MLLAAKISCPCSLNQVDYCCTVVLLICILVAQVRCQSTNNSAAAASLADRCTCWRCHIPWTALWLFVASNIYVPLISRNQRFRSASTKKATRRISACAEQHGKNKIPHDVQNSKYGWLMEWAIYLPSTGHSTPTAFSSGTCPIYYLLAGANIQCWKR